LIFDMYNVQDYSNIIAMLFAQLCVKFDIWYV
jgi:hypothetical protein